jgi:hypothetical protein
MTSKPTATVTIEVPRSRAPSPEHAIRVALKLSAAGARHGDREHVAAIARRALTSLASAGGEPAPPRITDVTVTRKEGRSVPAATIVVAVEGHVDWPGRPDDDAVDDLRGILSDEGYRVEVRERRACGEPGCHVEATLGWNHPAEVPSGWHSATICGGHNYRTCAGCNSRYVLTSTNSVGQAPSVHCEVCGQVIVEWGSSKVWTAQLVSRG